MIWLQEFGSNSPASELNWGLLPEGSGHQVRCSVQLHPGLSVKSWSTCTAPGGLFGLGVGRAGTSAPQRWGLLPWGQCHGPSQVRRGAFGDALQGHTLFYGINIYFFP